MQSARGIHTEGLLIEILETKTVMCHPGGFSEILSHPSMILPTYPEKKIPQNFPEPPTKKEIPG